MIDMAQDQLEQALAALPPSCQSVMRWRYGLVDGQPKTREEVCFLLGLTLEDFKKREARALKLLGQPPA